MVWMGAAAGQLSCIATITRICARYGNLDILEDGYGINLLPLATFALRTYKDDPCAQFKVKGGEAATEAENRLKHSDSQGNFHYSVQTGGSAPGAEAGIPYGTSSSPAPVDYEKGTITIKIRNIRCWIRISPLLIRNILMN